MAIQRRQPTNIYLTFKVFQLVNQLRRRLKPRVLPSDPTKQLLGSKTCLGLEANAFKSIEQCLSRVSGVQERKQLHHASNRICKNRKGTRPSLKLQTPGKHDPANPNTSGEEVQHMLKSLDNGNFNNPDNALSAIAANDKLFLKQNDSPNFEPCSLNEIITYLLLVHDGIDVLYHARSQYDDQWLISQGSEIGLNIDEAFIANYEHLLLRLRAQLIDALTRKVIEALLEGGQDKKQRKLLSWFTEFPNSKRPLSTTWPWSIKPSLAVLWGVCWMFYNSGDRNNRGVRQTRFLQDEQFPEWNTPQPNDSCANSGAQADINFGLELTGTQSQPQAQQQADGDVGSIGVSGVDLRQNVGWTLSAPNNLSGHVPVHQHSSSGRSPAQPQPRRNPRQANDSSQFAPDRHPGPIIAGLGPDTFSGPTDLAYNNYASTSHASAGIPAGQEQFSPENTGIATTPSIFAFSQHSLDVNSLAEPWQLQFTQHQSSTLLPQRPRSASHLTVPDIRVTPGNQAADTEGFTAPHQDFFSTIYEQSPQPPQAPQLSSNNIRIDTNINNFANAPYNMGNCPPDTSPIHTQIMRHERTPSNSNSTNMPTPVSISAPRSPLRSPIHERRPSIGSSVGHPRDASEDRSSADGDNALSSRRNHAYKRSEEPPRNREGKMICKHKECANITFERKCEWSKHMDKHDRPYKCNVKGCEKLQGFTYSGGLLRHEREVHKMHGGTKKSLFCPFPDCKRSSGSGFTRKENLAEHIRRVHRRTSTSSDLGNLVIPRPDTQDETTDMHLRPEYPTVETQEEEIQLGSKRKRISDAGFSGDGDDDLRAEVKRLRRENEEKDARLRQLEAAVMALQQGQR
ncbi:hypothetical protein K469DRAFT_682341 [Zopfia rhizophila CBS 207.26]|uniref:C2H2-type domain-containing protein n=1 Tax=Zopfia rhizophila CBS 207.26 TaxID=1314779 RepID=A0A6A6EFB6_9PEZI|nr:hypothetical protein K469DRAFT_682341 [Zopfia rhizophila CBS 207.26]